MFKIGNKYKQSSGYISEIIGKFKHNGEKVFVAITNNPNEPYMCYWKNGNLFHFNKKDNSTNSTIRECDIIKD